MCSAKRVFLVTGAAGFVGANVCRRLVDNDCAVHAIVAPGSDTWRLRELEGQLHLRRIDVCDGEGISRAVRDIRPSVIYHLATYGAYPFQSNPERIILTNVLGLWNLLNACNEVGYELFVNTGSSSEYGEKRHAMRETDLLEPNSFYAVAKASQTLLSQQVAESPDLPIVTLRLFSVYGPYEERTRLIPTLIMSALEGRPIDMVSPETCRDFIHTEDVVDAYLLIDELKRHPKETFNIGTGVQTSMREIVATTAARHGREIDARWGAMEARPWDTSTWVADISKARRMLGWQPKVSLAEGIDRCLEWFRLNAHLYGSAVWGVKAVATK